MRFKRSISTAEIPDVWHRPEHFDLTFCPAKDGTQRGRGGALLVGAEPSERDDGASVLAGRKVATRAARLRTTRRQKLMRHTGWLSVLAGKPRQRLSRGLVTLFLCHYFVRPRLVSWFNRAAVITYNPFTFGAYQGAHTFFDSTQALMASGVLSGNSIELSLESVRVAARVASSNSPFIAPLKQPTRFSSNCNERTS